MPQYMTQTTETYTPDSLIAGETHLATRSALIAAGQGVLARGTLMGMVTATGKLIVSTATANDGSQNPFGVLIDQYDTSAADVFGGAYVRGEFNANAMTFGAGWNAATAFTPLRDAGIYLKPVLTQSGQNVG